MQTSRWMALYLELNLAQKTFRENELVNLKILTLALKLFRPPKAKSRSVSASLCVYYLLPVQG